MNDGLTARVPRIGRSWWLFGLSLLTCGGTVASAGSPGPVACPDLRSLTTDAFKRRDKESAHRLFACLPKTGELAIFQGDMAISEADLQQYLSSRGESAKLPLIGPSNFQKLNVDEKLGVLNYWRIQRDRKMTYALDGKSFSNTSDYLAVQKAFVAAAAEWVAICRECGISFDYRWTLDWKEPSPSNDLTFVVRRQNSNGVFVALSFFPDAPTAKRVVYVDDAFQTTKHDHAGVFRHEIGHILGYRHERPDDPASGCALENGSWFSLTESSDESVMQYTCGTNGKPRTFAITPDDARGHRALYLGASFLETANKLPPIEKKRRLDSFLKTIQ